MRLAALLLAVAALALVVVPGCSFDLEGCLDSCCDQVGGGNECKLEAKGCADSENPDGCIEQMAGRTSSTSGQDCFYGCALKD